MREGRWPGGYCSAGPGQPLLHVSVHVVRVEGGAVLVCIRRLDLLLPPHLPPHLSTLLPPSAALPV